MKIKTLLLIFLSGALLCSFTSTPPYLKKTSKEQADDIRNGIDRILADADSHIHLGIEIVSLKNGQKLYQKNENKLFVPSSTLKIFTGVSALGLLGVDYRFETKLLTDGSIKEGVLEGNLYFKGSGDPELSVQDLKDLIFQLKLLSVQAIKGDLILDNSDFDGVVQGPGWMWDEGAEYWNSPMDALTIDHSCIHLWVQPAKVVGAAPLLTPIPKTNYVSIQNLATTTETKGNLSVERRWLTRENLIQIEGSIKQGSAPQHYEIPVEFPHLYAGSVLVENLLKEGICFEGKTVESRTPDTARVLATHLSSPLSLIVFQMMKRSDNLYADCLFKKMGQVRFGAPGSWTKGAQAVRDFLQKNAELNLSDLVILDGCGLSRYNLISPHALVSFLSWAHEQFKFAPEFTSSLPISGVDGILKERMEDIRSKVRAETGAMSGISSLAGYATTKDGEVLAFAIMINGFVRPAKESKVRLEDQICSFLAQYSRNLPD